MSKFLTLLILLSQFYTIASGDELSKSMCEIENSSMQARFEKNLNKAQVEKYLMILKYNLASRYSEDIDIINDVEHDLWFDKMDELGAAAQGILGDEDSKKLSLTVDAVDDGGIIALKKMKIDDYEIAVRVSSTPLVSSKKKVRAEKSSYYSIAITKDGQTSVFDGPRDAAIFMSKCRELYEFKKDTGVSGETVLRASQKEMNKIKCEQ